MKSPSFRTPSFRKPASLFADVARCTLIIALVWLLSGCSLAGVRGPGVSLVDATFTDVSLLETEMEFTIRLENQTPDELAINGAVYTITLNGTEIGSGSSGERLVIPPFGRDVHTVRVGVSNFTFINQIRSLVEAKRFEYSIDAEFYLDRLGFRRAQTAKTGRFDFREMESTGRSY